MPVLLQAAGALCALFAFTVFARPRIRPSPAAYLCAITVDALAILFALAVLISWPAWWLLIPLLLWAAVLTMHLMRLRDARVMVAVLRANHPPAWNDPRRRTRGSPYAEDAWRDDPPDRYRY